MINSDLVPHAIFGNCCSAVTQCFDCYTWMDRYEHIQSNENRDETFYSRTDHCNQIYNPMYYVTQLSLSHTSISLKTLDGILISC